MADPWSTWNVGNYKSNLDPSLMALTSQPDTLQALMQSPGTAYSPDRRYMIGSDKDNLGNKYYSIYDTTQGAGEPIYQYGSDGRFQKTRAGAKIMGQLRGVLAVAGAALGFGALGGAASGAAAGAADGAATGANGAFLGEGAASGVGAWDAALANASGGGLLNSLSQAYKNPLVRQGVKSGMNAMMSGGGSSNGGGMDLGSIFNAVGPLVGGMTDAYQQGQASDKMIGWLNGQQERIDKLYAPGSPEYNALWDQMSAKDAAAGRNSQYGTRSVDLAGRIAQVKAENNARLASSFARPYSEALNQNAGRFQSLGGALSNMGANGTLGQLINLLTGKGGFGSGGYGGGSVGVPSNPYFQGGDNFDFTQYDTGYVDPTTIDYAGDFAYPDAGLGDWGGDIDVSSWF